MSAKTNKQRKAIDSDYKRNHDQGKKGNIVTDIVRSVGGSERARQAYKEGKKQRR